MLETSCTDNILEGATWQKVLILALVPSSIRSVERQTITSGDRPRDRSSLTECWVGFVFCSPPAPPTTGRRDTCTNKTFSRPTERNPPGSLSYVLLSQSALDQLKSQSIPSKFLVPMQVDSSVTWPFLVLLLQKKIIG